MLNIVIIDNHDSFTYNLVELLRKTGLCSVDVCYIQDIRSRQFFESYDGAVLSPGPGLPEEKAGLFDLIKNIEGRIPILGVCLGHQAIAQYFGAGMYQLDRIIHGESSELELLSASFMFHALSESILVGRYHSWAIEEKNWPDELCITSRSKCGILMSFEHRVKNIVGLQFHPESILTPEGYQMLKNWLKYYVKKTH